MSDAAFSQFRKVALRPSSTVRALTHLWKTERLRRRDDWAVVQEVKIASEPLVGRLTNPATSWHGLMRRTVR